jgi:quercetin dioxygenase-like cupin family protein
VAYVLSGEITFKIGDAVTVGQAGSCAFLPKGVAHAWKNTGDATGQVIFLYTPAGAGKFFEEQVAKPLTGPANGPAPVALRERHGWEVVGPPPF